MYSFAGEVMSRVLSFRPRALAVLGQILLSINTATAAPLTVSAGSSLGPVLREVSAAFAGQQPASPVTLNLGSSGSLQRQIENGAPVDVFVSAAAKNVEALAAKGLVEAGSRRTVASNTLVLIAPRDAATPTGWADLASVSPIALGEPSSVPAGAYAVQTLQAMGLWDAIRPHAVYAKDVRQVLVYVESGNAAAGFVYGSDARSSSKVRVVATAAADSHERITCDAAVVSASPNRAQASAFIDFLASPAAREIFARHGFGPP